MIRFLKWQRMMVLVLVCVLSLTVFAGCSNTPDDSSVTTTTTESAADATTTVSTSSTATAAPTGSTSSTKQEGSMTMSTTKSTVATTTTTTRKQLAVGGTWGEPQKSQPGLYVEDGVIKLAGKKFYGIGTNYYDAVLRPYVAPLNGDIESGIKNLAGYGFSFVRARFSAWGSEGMDDFWNDRETFFATTDYFVSLCEKYNIGIIATLVWTPYQYLDDETPTYADLYSNTDSKGYQRMLEYVEAIVTRYKNSPAIWGWEIGNEFNLDVDLHNKDMNKGFNTLIMSEFYADLSARIHQWDGTDRIISTGSSQDRGASFNLAANGTWTRDTLEELENIYKTWNPGDISVSSIHVYNRTQWLDGETVPVSDYLAALVDICKKQGKPLYIGEYCDDEMNNVEERTEAVLAESLQKFQVVHDAIVANDIQLSTLWIYWDQVDPYIHLTGHKYANYYKYMMDCAKEANEKYASEGKQDVDSYWNSMKNVVN